MTFDLVCGGVALLFLLLGMMRGLVRQLFGVIGFVGGLVAARFLAGPLADVLGPLVGLSRPAAAAACAIALFILCEIAFKVVGNLLHERLGTFTGAVDRVSGAGLGFVKGVLVAWALASLFGLLHRHAPGMEQRLPALARLELAHSRAIEASADASALGSYEDQLRDAHRTLQKKIRG